MAKGDLPAVISVEVDANPLPWKPGDFQVFVPPESAPQAPAGPFAGAMPRERRGAEHRAWVWADPEVRGFLCAVGVVDEVEVQEIAVVRSHRGRGIGSGLIQAMLDWAGEGAYRAVHLEVREGNAPALELYRKWGFRPSGRRPGYYPDTGEDALILTRRV